VSTVSRTLKLVGSMLITLLFVSYSVLPTYIVQAAGDGSARVLPHDPDFSTIANRTFRMPGIEEMDGDFHHHDAQGNDQIRVVKKDGAIRENVDLTPISVIDDLPPSHTFMTDGLVAPCRNGRHDRSSRHRIHDGFLSGKTGNSPPTFS
jgi:hypothetical protein